MDDTKTVRAKIVRDFNDAGAERSFSANQVVDLPEGTFANYRAAGLVEAAPADPEPSEPASGQRRH